MTHEGIPSLISLDLSYHLQRDESPLRRWLVGSLVFHLVVALVATHLRFSPTIEQPMASYEVSLVSLPAFEKPTSAEPKPQEKTLPPLPTKTSSERLAESLAGAAQSIVVPKTRTSQPQSKPVPEVKTSSDPSEALENIKPPPQAPSLTKAEPTPPAPARRPAQKMSPQETLKGMKTKALPKTPASTPLHPFTKASADDPSPAKPDQLSQLLKERLKAVHAPLIKPRQKARKPNKRPAQKRERLSDSLKKILKPLTGPKLRDTKTPPRRPESVRPDRDSPESKKLRTDIDKQLANLKIPEVVPTESIRTRLQLQSESASSPSTASSSKSSKGQNRYLGLIQAKIDQQWIAPKVVANEKNLQVTLKFRILRSGAVTKLGIDRGSGNSYYDSAAERAVQAAHLPPFPSDIAESYLDVRYNFLLGDLSS